MKPMKREGKRRFAGFTLLELLVVISIILAMAVLLVPAFNNIGKANALSNTGNSLANLAAIAQQNSMAKNTLTALIIPVGDSGWNSAALYELTSRDDGSAPTSSDWRQISKWEIFPEGITIDQTTFVDESKSSLLPAPLPAIKRGGNTVGNYCFVAFLPRGTLYSQTLPASGNPSLRLVQAIRTGSAVKYTGATEGGVPKNIYEILILSSTGITKINRS